MRAMRALCSPTRAAKASPSDADAVAKDEEERCIKIVYQSAEKS